MLTGSLIAKTVIRYAAALARHGTSTTIGVPGRTEDGVEGPFDLLIGPASQIIVETTSDDRELVDAAFIAQIEEAILALDRPVPTPRFEDPPILGYDGDIV